jgi:CxxC-x17-CxxC domain-containing protein
MKGTAPKLYQHRCQACGCAVQTPFPPRKGITVHCTACHARLASGESPLEIRKAARKISGDLAAQTYMGRKQELHEAICSACNQPCQLPFLPAEGQVILCRACYRAQQVSRREES